MCLNRDTPKIIFLTCNVFILTLGFAIIIRGCVEDYSTRPVNVFVEINAANLYKGLSVGSTILIILGILVTGAGFMIFCGVLLHSTFLVLLYATIMLGVGTAALTVGSLWVIKNLAGTIEGKLQRDWKKPFEQICKNFSQYSDCKHPFLRMQKEFQCCGISSYADYEMCDANKTVTNPPLPKSCCVSRQVSGCQSNAAWPDGCITNVKKWLIKTCKVLAYCCIVFGFLLVLFAFGALCYVCPPGCQRKHND